MSIIGVVIVTHGLLAQELRRELEHVVGGQSQFATLSVSHDTLPEDVKAELLQAINDVDSGRGVIILSDIFGSTPSNISVSAIEGIDSSMEVIAGVNLPMLVELASLRTNPDCEFFEVVERARNAGRKYINIASQVMCRYPSGSSK
jgi:PTS system mannose-specific IIA component